MLRVRVHGGGLLPDRELHAHAIDDRAAARRDRHRLVLLVRRQPVEVGCPDGLEPDRAGQREAEHGQQEDEQQANAAVGLPPPAH